MHEFMTRMKPKQKKHFSELRSALVGMPEVEETLEIDETDGDWCPAYRVRGSDLAWVHFGEKMWVGIPVEPAFEKKVFQDENLDSFVVESVKEAEETGGVKLARLEIRSPSEIEGIIPLLRLRHSVLRA